MTQQRGGRSSIMEQDDLGPAQGIMVGLLMSAILWIVVLMPL
jgi:hypothetical protein